MSLNILKTQVKLQEEIDDLMESKEEGEEINAEDITNMNYLDQVLKKNFNPLILGG